MTNNKTVWENYGKYAIMAFVLVLVLIAAWQYYANQQERNLLEASRQYDKMMKAFLAKDSNKADDAASLLLDKYENTPYAAFAALLQGRIKVDKNDLAKAEEHFTDAIDLASDGPIAHVARVRLARVLAAEQKLDEALKVLSESKDNEGYVALYEETKGDIYVQQKNFAKAREAYKAAEQSLPPGVQLMALQLKQNDINKETNTKESNAKANTVKDSDIKEKNVKENGAKESSVKANNTQKDNMKENNTEVKEISINKEGT